MQKLITYLFLCCGFISISFTAHAQETTSPKPYLQIIHFNVGQADATLIVGTNGKTLLYDTGLKGEAERNVVPALKALGIDAIDYLMVSHYDKDHIAGVLALGGFLTEDTLSFDRGEVPATKNLTNKLYTSYENGIDKTQRSTVALGEQSQIQLGEGVSIRAVAVNGTVINGDSVEIGNREENATSIALHIRYGKFDYFVAGDLTSDDKGDPDVEGILAPLLTDIDVYRVSHHGSPTSNSAVLLDVLRPEVAILSVGFHKGHMLPKKEVLERIAGIDTNRPTEALFMTNLGYPGDNLSTLLLERMRVANGHVTVFTNGEHYFVNGQIYATDGR